MYSTHLSFPTFNNKMTEFCTLQVVMPTMSKELP